MIIDNMLVKNKIVNTRAVAKLSCFLVSVDDINRITGDDATQ
jgi:hypothetical protein